MFGELTGGVTDGVRGASYLVRNPRLWVWVLLPAVIIGALLFLSIGWLLAFLHGPLARVTSFIPGHWAAHVIEVLAGLVLAVASLAIVLSLAALIAGPFNEMLSEAIEERVTGVPGPTFHLGHFLYDLLIGAIHAVRRIAIYLVTMGLLLLAGIFIPVAGALVTTIGGVLATARFASYDAYDAVFSRRRMRYRDKMAHLNANLWRTMGLGAVVSAVLLVPGLNLIALSIGAAGATLRSIDVARAAPAQRTAITRS